MNDILDDVHDIANINENVNMTDAERDHAREVRLRTRRHYRLEPLDDRPKEEEDENGLARDDSE